MSSLGLHITYQVQLKAEKNTWIILYYSTEDIHFESNAFWLVEWFHDCLKMNLENLIAAATGANIESMNVEFIQFIAILYDQYLAHVCYSYNCFRFFHYDSYYVL